MGSYAPAEAGQANSQFIKADPDFLRFSPPDRQLTTASGPIQLEGFEEIDFVPSHFNAHAYDSNMTTNGYLLTENVASICSDPHRRALLRHALWERRRIGSPANN
jgi:hypothetical protein